MYSIPFLCVAEKCPNPSLLSLCGSLAQLACVEPVRLQAWLTRMTASPPKDSDQLDTVQENRQLLQLLTSYIVRDNSQVGEGVCTVLLSTLIPMATEMLASGDGAGFPELMVIMATLASAGQGAGHLQLHRAAIDWLSRWWVIKRKGWRLSLLYKEFLYQLYFFSLFFLAFILFLRLG